MYEKHGKCHTRPYRIWFLMKQRCNNPKASNYERYGGRGISVCAEWSDNFPAFEAWALANGYADDLTLDRINNDGNYEPSNCRWVDIQTQMINRSNTRWETINGETHTLKEWAEISGINIRTLCARYDRGDRGEYLIRQRNIRSNTRIVTINGESHDLKEWAELTGANLRTLQSRYDRGYRGERLIKRKEATP